MTSDEAFDVAALISSQPRPEMTNLDKDYPDRAAKPVDDGYGPFTPIEAYYKALKGEGVRRLACSSFAK